jgi:hypothetical protein
MQDTGLVSGIALFFGFGLAGVILLGVSRRDAVAQQQQTNLFLVGFVVRFLLSLAIYQFGLIDVLKDEDGSGWVVGRSIQQGWVRSGASVLDLPWLLAETFQGDNRGYWNLLGAFFFVTDQPSRMSAAVLNCFCGAMTVVLVYRIGDLLFGRSVANRAAWLTCLFPSMIVWSAQTIKEPIIIFLESVVLYGCIQLRRSDFSPRYALLTLAACVMIFPLRFYAAYIAVVSVSLALLIPKMNSKRGISLLWVLMVPLFLLTAYLLQRESRLERFNLQQIEAMKEYGGKAEGSGVAMDYDLQSPSGLGIALAIGAIHLLFAPFPWQMGGGSLRMLLVGPEVLVWWGIFFYAVIPGMRYCIRKRFVDVLPVLLFLGGLGLLYSLTFSNVGLIYRQRAQLLPYFFIFAAVGFECRKAMARRRKAAVTGGKAGRGGTVPAAAR